MFVFLLLVLLCSVIHPVMAVNTPPISSLRRIDDLIVAYFSLNLSYGLILSFLTVCHQVHMSLSTLKRKLRRLGLHRRKWGLLDLHQAVLTIQVILYSRLYCRPSMRNVNYLVITDALTVIL